MNTTINSTSYPYFVPDQVLTAEDLNTLVNYLEGLNQITRTHLIGMGIAQGLEVQTLEKQTKVKITPGCGITSKGFVIKISAETKADPGITFTHYRDGQTLPKNLFIPGEPAQESYIVTELIAEDQEQAKDSSLKPLDKATVTDKVIVALYYWQDVKRSENCFLSYDTAGLDRNAWLRFFLLPIKEPKKDSTSQAGSPPKAESSVPEPTVLSAEHLLRASYPVDQMPELWRSDAQANITTVFEARNTFFKEFYPQMQRFGYVKDAKSIDLTKISDYNAWQDNYNKICKEAIDPISNAFLKLYQLFSPVFISFHPNSSQAFQALAGDLTVLLNRFDPKLRKSVPANKTEPPYALQYFYDYLSQLVAAFFELAEAAFDLMDDCTPELDRFPQFLMLGIVPSSDGTPTGYELPSAYRTQFIQPRIYNNNQRRIQEVRYLYERLLKLCEIQEKAPLDKDKPENQSVFFLLPFYRAPIKITPSKDPAAPLSERAIPYYLNYPKLYRYWNYDAYRKGRSDRHPAYFYPKQASGTSHTFDELTYRLDAYNFYRIEGHIGRSNTDAFKAIQEYQQRYNLPFDIITLKLGNLDSLKDLDVSAQVADLNANFGRLKDRFQTLWKVNQKDWLNNALINTLKQIFFDQWALEKINPDLMLSPFLDRAQVSESYDFVAQRDANHQPTGKYELFLKNRSGTHIAQYIFHISEVNISDQQRQQDFHFLNFSGLTETEIKQEKSRITAGMVNALTLDKITYKLEPSFHLRLSSKDVLPVPLDPAQPGSQKVPQKTVTVELRSLTPFSISITSGQPQVDDAACPDVLTLYGLLQDVPEDFVTTNELKFKIGDKKVAEELGASELRGLVEAYQQRLQRLIGLHFFHLFAQQHPGLEPLGGVPRGGTFVLVYMDEQDSVKTLLADDRNSIIVQARIDRAKIIQSQASLPPSSTDKPSATQFSDDPESLEKEIQKEIEEIKARKDIVIADFCLPYRSSSDAPSVSYILARPRPIVLLEKPVFCEGDTKEYPFVLEPEGGTVKGEGVIFNGHQHLFQPSRVSQAIKDELVKGNEIAITFSYAVDDTYDTLTVTVYPLPRPNLTIQEGQSFCQNASPVEIGLAPGAPETVELGVVKINGMETRRLDPSQFAANGQSEMVTIEAYVRDRQSNCTNTLTRRVTINPLPAANLSVNEGQNFCQDASPVEITLAPGTPAEIELLHVTINDIETNTLAPNQYATEGQPQSVTITARIRNQQTQCENTLTRRVTVHPLPQANLSISEGQSFLRDGASLEIRLAPDAPADVELIHVTINGTPTTTLIPGQYATHGQSETVTIEAHLRDRQSNCTNTITRRVTITPLPEANLSVNEGQSFCQDASPVEITLAPGTPAAIELVHVTINGTATNTLVPSQYATQGQPQTVTIAAQLRDQQTQRENTLTRTVTINPLPEAILSIQEGQNFCQDASPVEITLAPGTPEEIELVHVMLNGTEANTLAPNQYATQGQPQTITIATQIRNRQTQCENTLTRTVTVHPLPIADFKAEITNISGTGFSVRVFDIQPPGQPSFTFNWDIPNGSPNPSNPGSSGFTIDYNFDFDNWVAGANRSITLRVSTPSQLGGCISQPVTKTIAVPFGGVQAFDLLTISPDGDTTSNTPLEDGSSFTRSSFTTNNTFEAIAIGQVGSVIFTHTDPNGNVTTSPPVPAGSPANGLYHFTMLGNSGHYWPWQPTVGRHQLKAQAFKESNGNGLEGVALTMTLTVTDGNASPPPSPANPNSPNLFNRLSNFLRPANPRIFTPQAVAPSVAIAAPERHRALNLFDLSSVQSPSSGAQPFSQATVSLLLTDPTSSNEARGLPSTDPDPAQLLDQSPPLQANTRATAPDPAKSPGEQPQTLQTFERHLNNGFKVKLTQTLALSGVMLLLILGWAYTSNQPKTSSQPSSSEKIQNSTQ